MLTSQSGRPICKKCGVYPVHPNGKSKLGYTKWRTLTKKDLTRKLKFKQRQRRFIWVIQQDLQVV